MEALALPPPARRRIAALGIVALAVAAAGCSIFRPRNAEAPLGPPVYISYALPESTLDTMRRGVENRTGTGVDAYVGGLADSASDGRAFYAFHDPDAVAASGKTPPSSWTLGLERNFISRFVSVVVTKECQMSWGPDEEHPHDEEIGPDEWVLHRRYVVKTLPPPSGGSTDTVAIGFADLTVEQVSAGRWAITRWQDRVDPAIGAYPLKSTWLSFSARRLETSF